VPHDASSPAISITTRSSTSSLSTDTLVPLNAWSCDCGAHGVAESQPSAHRGLERHLNGTGHGQGEYYYGHRDQRTSVRVTADEDGRFTHRLLPSS
jgi:hypothetical protein